MAWVWYDAVDAKFVLKFDPKSPIHISDVWDMVQEDIGERRGLYRTNVDLNRLESSHCPYVENYKPPVIDHIWKTIILGFVPEDRVLFVPLDIRCRNGVSKKYWWMVPRDLVTCIDLSRSELISKIEKNGRTLIFDVGRIVHHKDCLNGLHLAFDRQMLSHLIISNELRTALAATGESSMFYKPEDLPVRGS